MRHTPISYTKKNGNVEFQPRQSNSKFHALHYCTLFPEGLYTSDPQPVTTDWPWNLYKVPGNPYGRQAESVNRYIIPETFMYKYFSNVIDAVVKNKNINFKTLTTLWLLLTVS